MLKIMSLKLLTWATILSTKKKTTTSFILENQAAIVSLFVTLSLDLWQMVHN